MRTADQNISHGKEKNFLTDVWLETLAKRSEAVLLPLGALIVGLLTFGLFLYFLGKSPFDFYALVYKAGFGTFFSWQNTLSRTAPLLFAALCVALPARLGLMVIGGEGAIVLVGVTFGVLAGSVSGLPGIIAILLLTIASMLVAGVWSGAVGLLLSLIHI